MCTSDPFSIEFVVHQCVGVRFFVGKFVELAYLDAALAKVGTGSSEQWSGSDLTLKSMSDSQAMDALRMSLGHPLGLSNTVRCIVTGVHGMDAASASDRLIVASRLWAEGISAEYIPQSGVMISLLRRYREAFEPMGEREAVSVCQTSRDWPRMLSAHLLSHPTFHFIFDSQDWSLNELFGVCAILKIPFVVIVQPHLLRDKGSIRLRRIAFDSLSGSTGGNEIFVSLDNLASTVAVGADEDIFSKEPQESSRSLKQTPMESDVSSGQKSSYPQVECIYVDTDQYYGLDKQVNKSDTSHWKSILKGIKSVSQRSEAYLNEMTETHMSAPVQGTPVFAVNLSFWELRDFGTCLMKNEGSAMGASLEEITKTYPRHKKLFKTLCMAIDNLMRKYGMWYAKDTKDGASTQVTILLYSKMDDRFDMISLGGLQHHSGGESASSDRAGRKTDRR